MDLMAAGGNEHVMLAVLWPGDGWAKALTYPFEGRDADDSARALCRWLTVNVDKNASVSFIAHSLGCRVAMEAAQRLVWSGNSPRLGRICLMAPAIDNDSLGKMCVTCYRDATLAAEQVAVLASREDRVLQFSYPLGDLAQTLLYGERWGKALGRTGPDEHDADVLAKIAPVPKADPSRSIDHHDYLGLAPNDKPPHTKAESEKFVLEFFKPPISRSGRRRGQNRRRLPLKWIQSSGHRKLSLRQLNIATMSYRIPDQVEYKPDPISSHLWIPAFAGMTPWFFAGRYTNL